MLQTPGHTNTGQQLENQTFRDSPRTGGRLVAFENSLPPSLDVAAPSALVIKTPSKSVRGGGELHGVSYVVSWGAQILCQARFSAFSCGRSRPSKHTHIRGRCTSGTFFSSFLRRSAAPAEVLDAKPVPSDLRRRERPTFLYGGGGASHVTLFLLGRPSASFADRHFSSFYSSSLS